MVRVDSKIMMPKKGNMMSSSADQDIVSEISIEEFGYNKCH